MRLGLILAQTLDMCCPVCGLGSGEDEDYAGEITLRCLSDISLDYSEVAKKRTANCPRCGKPVMPTFMIIRVYKKVRSLHINDYKSTMEIFNLGPFTKWEAKSVVRAENKKIKIT